MCKNQLIVCDISACVYCPLLDGKCSSSSNESAPCCLTSDLFGVKKVSLTSLIPSHISDSGKFFDCGIINFAIKFLQLSGKLVKKRNFSYYGMSIIYIYLCIFYWSQRSRFSQTRELIKSWPLAVFVWWIALWFLCISF